MAVDLDTMLTVTQAAKTVGVHVATFIRWIDNKRVIGVKKFGNSYVVAPDFKILTPYSPAFLSRAVSLRGVA